jgi:5-methylcytosine-specific restriction endonuclease McrA
MMTAEERVKIGLPSIYVEIPSNIRHYIWHSAEEFQCLTCLKTGPWHEAVIDPAARDDILCPSCHDTVGTVFGEVYDGTMAEWWQVLRWRQQPGREKCIRGVLWGQVVHFCVMQGGTTRGYDGFGMAIVRLIFGSSV